MKLIEHYVKIFKNYKDLIFSVEDPLHENDLEGWQQFHKEMKKMGILVVGDDITVTQTHFIKKYSEFLDMVIIKPNQNGTISGTIDAMNVPGVEKMLSHRSGETEDLFIVDFIAYSGCTYAKMGASCRGERTMKYNEIIRKFK